MFLFTLKIIFFLLNSSLILMELIKKGDHFNLVNFYFDFFLIFYFMYLDFEQFSYLS